MEAIRSWSHPYLPKTIQDDHSIVRINPTDPMADLTGSGGRSVAGVTAALPARGCWSVAGVTVAQCGTRVATW